MTAVCGAIACASAGAVVAGQAPVKINLERYASANAAVIAGGKRPCVVFMGDSITEGWAMRAKPFFGTDRVGRGISGETTAQMLARFDQDVIALRPKVVHIMGGTNDIALNGGPITARQTLDNVATMARRARASGIRVVIASVPPASSYNWRPEVTGVGASVRALNARLRDYARRSKAVYADYWKVLRDGDALPPRFGSDGVHPNAAGYAAMALVAENALKRMGCATEKPVRAQT